MAVPVIVTSASALDAPYKPRPALAETPALGPIAVESVSEALDASNGRQPGDPAKAVAAIRELALSTDFPRGQ